MREQEKEKREEQNRGAEKRRRSEDLRQENHPLDAKHRNLKDTPFICMDIAS